MSRTFLRPLLCRPWIVVAVWGLLALFVTVLANCLTPYMPLDSGDFLPEHSPTVQGYQLLRQCFDEDVAESSIVLVLHRDTPLGKSEQQLVQHVERAIEQLRRQHPEFRLGNIRSWNSPWFGWRLVSADRKCTLVIVDVNWPFVHDRASEAVQSVQAVTAMLVQAHNAAYPAEPPVQLTVTGTAGFGRDLNEAMYHSLDVTTWATLALVVGLLLVLYRDPSMALVPVLTVGTAVWVSLKCLEIISAIFGVPLINIARIFVVVVLFGAGTDYCLFLLGRFREELTYRPPVEAMEVTLRRVGGALFASAGVVIFGLAMMAFAEFARVSAVGPYVAVSLAICLVAALTLAPACLLSLTAWSRPEVVAGRHRVPSHETIGHFWRWISERLAARPGTIWLATTFVLVPLACSGACNRATMDVCAELSPQAESRQGMEIIRQHFPAGEIGPLTVLLIAPEETPSATLRQAVQKVSGVLAGIDNVLEVRSWAHPLGRRSVVSSSSGASPAGLSGLSHSLDWLSTQLATSYYLRRHATGWVTRLEIVLGSDPFSPASVATLAKIRQTLQDYLAHGECPFVRFAVYGITSFTADLAQVHERDRWRVNTLVLLGILAILIAVVRSLGWAIYLLATVLLNYFVTLGAVSWLGTFWLGTELGVTDWKVPYFLFVILVAIGEDYNIFLMSRIREEQRRLGAVQGIVHALARTGATISICGLIMAGAFSTMILSKLVTLTQLGLALAIGVLLETFVVRPILVPAALLWWYRRRWSDDTNTVVSMNREHGSTQLPDGLSQPDGLNANRDNLAA
jgi:RND superfamily putative drug exporter